MSASPVIDSTRPGARRWTASEQADVVAEAIRSCAPVSSTARDHTSARALVQHSAGHVAGI